MDARDPEGGAPLRSRPPTWRRLLSVLAVSVLLHVLVFAFSRVSRAPEHVLVHSDAMEIVSITKAVPPSIPASEPSPEPMGAASPSEPGVVATSENVVVRAALHASLLADLRAGMQSLTGLKRASLTMDDSDVALASAHAADTILAAPYPFARVGGVRVGLAGGGNCPASFP